MSKKRLGQEYSKRSFVIGIDETNNGRGIVSRNPNHYSSVMLVTGYLGDNTIKDKNYQGSIYEDKEGVFREMQTPEGIETAINHGKIFLQQNPHFYYTVVSSELYKGRRLIELRGDSIAILTYKFILSYALDFTDVQIICDEIDGKERSHEIGEYLKLKGIDIPYRFISHSEHVKIPCRKADRCGYWLAALHFLGKNHKWPYKHRRVNLRSLDKLTFEVSQMMQKDYPSEWGINPQSTETF
jgi:hypothetical protein